MSVSGWKACGVWLGFGVACLLLCTAPPILSQEFQPKYTLKGHADFVRSVAFSPDGKSLASGGGEGAANDRLGVVQLWDVPTGKEKGLFEKHRYVVYAVAFSPDGKTLASGGDDQKVRLWEVATGREKAALWKEPSHWGLSLAFSPNGKVLAAAGGRGICDGLPGVVRLWDVASGKEIASFLGNSLVVYSLAFSPDGKTLASGSMDGTVKLWEVATGKNTATRKGHAGGVWTVAFSPDGKSLASGGGRVGLPGEPTGTAERARTGEIKLWEVATGKETATLLGHPDPVLSVAFSPDGKSLASGSGSFEDWLTPTGTVVRGEVRLWNVTTDKNTITLKPSRRSVLCVAYSPDGQLLAAGSADGTIRLWAIGAAKGAAR